MPPKGSTKGRGGTTRARSTGRGAGNAGRAAESPHEAAAPETQVVLKQDDDEDSKPATPAENTPAPAEQQFSASVDAPYVNMFIHNSSTC